MTRIMVKAIQTVEREKTIELDIPASEVKDWLASTYGPKSEHGMDWNDAGLLAEFVEEIWIDNVDFEDDEPTHVAEVVIEAWDITSAYKKGATE